MSIDACAPQCRRGAGSKCRHPELKITFLKQLVNSDCHSFLLFLGFFSLSAPTDRTALASFGKASFQDGTGWNNAAFIGNHFAVLLLLLEISRAANLQKWGEKRNKTAKPLLQGASRLTLKRQKKSSKVTWRHEELFSVFPRGKSWFVSK